MSRSLPNLIDEAMVVAVGLRGDLESRIEWFREHYNCPAEPGQALTTGFCRGAAYGLLLVLQEEVPGIAWSLDGGLGFEAKSLTLPDGSPRPDLQGLVDPARWPGGLLGPDGQWHGHFWVVGETEDGERFIIDLTADQFGHEIVVVEPASDLRYRANFVTDRALETFTTPERAWGSGLQGDWRRLVAPRLQTGGSP